MSDQIFVEMADAWDAQAATQADLHTKERETLRMCADGLRMLVESRKPRDCPRAPAPFRYCPDCNGSFPCQMPGRSA